MLKRGEPIEELYKAYEGVVSRATYQVKKRLLEGLPS